MIEIGFKKIELEDKDLITHYFKHHTSRSCERTFVNVYLWARFYHVKFAEVEHTLVFRTEDEDGFSFAYPAGEPENVKKALDVRRSGSAAIDLCSIAAGRAELYFELRLSPWDFAAGALIVEEAGGVVTTVEGGAVNLGQKCSVLATNGRCGRLE